MDPGAEAIQRAAEELAASGPSAWQQELATRAYAPAAKQPLLVSPVATGVVRDTNQRSLALALLAGAAVALVGGLIWAGVVIATRWDIGFIAWFVGAAAGGTAFRVYGAPIRGAARIATGLIAAGAIVVGKYVIFVHDVKKVLGTLFVQLGLPGGQGPSLNYLDTRLMGIFIHHFGSIVKPIYVLWILIAFTAALMTAQPRKTRTARRG